MQRRVFSTLYQDKIVWPASRTNYYEHSRAEQTHYLFIQEKTEQAGDVVLNLHNLLTITTGW